MISAAYWRKEEATNSACVPLAPGRILRSLAITYKLTKVLLNSKGSPAGSEYPICRGRGLRVIGALDECRERRQLPDARSHG